MRKRLSFGFLSWQVSVSVRTCVCYYTCIIGQFPAAARKKNGGTRRNKKADLQAAFSPTRRSLCYGNAKNPKVRIYAGVRVVVVVG